jgi:hypothetical protein
MEQYLATTLVFDSYSESTHSHPLTVPSPPPEYAKAEFVDEFQTKFSKFFLLAIHSHLCSFCLEIYISSNSRNLLQFLKFSYCTL